MWYHSGTAYKRPWINRITIDIITALLVLINRCRRQKEAPIKQEVRWEIPQEWRNAGLCPFAHFRWRKISLNARVNAVLLENYLLFLIWGGVLPFSCLKFVFAVKKFLCAVFAVWPYINIQWGCCLACLPLCGVSGLYWKAPDAGLNLKFSSLIDMNLLFRVSQLLLLC